MPKLDDNVNHAPAVVAADDIVEAIHALRHLFAARQHKASQGSPLSLTHVEGKVLSFFDRNPGATQRDLVADSSRDKGQLARLISALKARGMLEASVDDIDRRVLHLHLTSLGREARAANDRQRARLAKLSVAGLTEDERRQLMTLLTRVRDNIEQA